MATPTLEPWTGPGAGHGSPRASLENGHPVTRNEPAGTGRQPPQAIHRTRRDNFDPRPPPFGSVSRAPGTVQTRTLRFLLSDGRLRRNSRAAGSLPSLGGFRGRALKALLDIKSKPGFSWALTSGLAPGVRGVKYPLHRIDPGSSYGVLGLPGIPHAAGLTPGALAECLGLGRAPEFPGVFTVFGRFPWASGRIA